MGGIRGFLRTKTRRWQRGLGREGGVGGAAGAAVVAIVKVKRREKARGGACRNNEAPTVGGTRHLLSAAYFRVGEVVGALGKKTYESCV
jgi:hypothetical protein